MVSAALRSDVEIVTVGASFPGPAAWRGNIPLGGAAEVGLHYDCFGMGAALVHRQAFEHLGGFEVDGPPALRRRDLLCRAALGGLRFEVVPEPLLEYDVEAAGRRSLGPKETLLRTLRPYQRALPEPLADLPGMVVAASHPTAPVEADERAAYVRDLEARLDTILSSRSWRATGALRRAMARIRRSG
jgi:hypothetical protein